MRLHFCISICFKFFTPGWYVVTKGIDTSVHSYPSTTLCMTTHRWRSVLNQLTRDRDKKAHGDLNYVWTQNDQHQPPLYQIAKMERCGNCRSRNLTYKFCIKNNSKRCESQAYLPSHRSDKSEQNITTNLSHWNPNEKGRRLDGVTVHPRVVRGAMHSGNKWRSAVWLKVMHSGKK